MTTRPWSFVNTCFSGAKETVYLCNFRSQASLQHDCHRQNQGFVQWFGLTCPSSCCSGATRLGPPGNFTLSVSWVIGKREFYDIFSFLAYLMPLSDPSLKQREKIERSHLCWDTSPHRAGEVDALTEVGDQLPLEYRSLRKHTKWV